MNEHKTPDVVDDCRKDDLLHLFNNDHAFFAMNTNTIIGTDMGIKDYSVVIPYEELYYLEDA